VKRIGLLSDTHGFIDPKIKKHFKDVDEIWHAGDIGTLEVLDELRDFKPTRAVWGNIDDHNIRKDTTGACGYKGFHKVKTILRFCITEDRIHDLELIELGPRA